MLNEFTTRFLGVPSTIYLIVGFSILLIVEYTKIKGYNKLKVLHFITSIFLIWHSSSSIHEIFYLFDNHKNHLLKHEFGLNQIDQTINSINKYYGTILNCVLFVISIGIAGRIEKARRIVVRLILWMIPSSMIAIYIGAKGDGGIYSPVYLVLGLIISIIVYYPIYFLYKQENMKEFFLQKPHLTLNL
jgi:hypothetical protein